MFYLFYFQLECNTDSSLSSSNNESTDEKPVWQRSVGQLSSKNNLTMLVKKKSKSFEEKQTKPVIDKTEEVSKTAKQNYTSSESISLLQQNVDVKNIPLPSESPKPIKDNSKIIPTKTLPSCTSGLGLLGAYSDSDSDSSTL